MEHLVFDLDKFANAIYNLSNDLLNEFRTLEQGIKGDGAVAIIGQDEVTTIKHLCEKLNVLNETKKEDKIHYTIINYLIGDYRRYYSIDVI